MYFIHSTVPGIYIYYMLLVMLYVTNTIYIIRRTAVLQGGQRQYHTSAITLATEIPF
jgi:hypothetical protein